MGMGCYGMAGATKKNHNFKTASGTNKARAKHMPRAVVSTVAIPILWHGTAWSWVWSGLVWSGRVETL